MSGEWKRVHLHELLGSEHVQRCREVREGNE